MKFLKATILLLSILPLSATKVLEVFVIEVKDKFIRPTYAHTVGRDQKTVEKTLASLRKLAKSEKANILVDARVEEKVARSVTRDIKFESATFPHAPAGLEKGYSIEWWASADLETRRRLILKRERESPDVNDTRIYESFDFSFYHQPSVGWSLSAAMRAGIGAIFIFEKWTPDQESVFSHKKARMMVGSISLEVPNKIEDDNMIRTLEDDDRLHAIMIRRAEGTLPAILNYNVSFYSEVAHDFKPTNMKFTFWSTRVNGFGRPLLPAVHLAMNRLAKLEDFRAVRHKDKFRLELGSDYASMSHQPFLSLVKKAGNGVSRDYSDKVGPKYYFDAAMFDFPLGPEKK